MIFVGVPQGGNAILQIAASWMEPSLEVQPAMHLKICYW